MSVLHLERQGDNEKLCITYIKFDIFGVKSLVFLFNFSFPYQSSNDRRLMIFHFSSTGLYYLFP